MVNLEEVKIKVRELSQEYLKTGKKIDLKTEPLGLLGVLCMEDVYTRGNTEFVEALFASKNPIDFCRFETIDKYFRDKYEDWLEERHFMPVDCSEEWTFNNYGEFKIPLISHWIYNSYPFMEVLKEAIEDVGKKLSSDTVVTDYLFWIVDSLWDGITPNFKTSAVMKYILGYLALIDFTNYGFIYDKTSQEVQTWQEFCQSPCGLCEIVQYETGEPLEWIATDMLTTYIGKHLQ